MMILMIENVNHFVWRIIMLKLMFFHFSQVSIDHKTRQMIEDMMDQPTQTVYDCAQEHVYFVMYHDCYPRFIVSNVFRALLGSN